MLQSIQTKYRHSLHCLYYLGITIVLFATFYSFNFCCISSLYYFLSLACCLDNIALAAVGLVDLLERIF